VNRQVAALLLLVLPLLGCGPKELPYSLPANELYAKGVEELEDGEELKAIELLQKILYEYPGSEYIERARLKIAEAYFNSGDYLLASNEYERFSKEFPLNPQAGAALYRAGIAQEKLSESHNLDQSETRKALSLFKSVEEKFPDGSYADSALVKSYFLNDRLAKKTFENGYFYYKRKYYDSAIIYFETMISEFETTSWLAPAYLYLAKAYDKLQLEDEAREIRVRLLDEYPLTLEAQRVREEYPELVPGEPSALDDLEGGGTG
jgi:outer membrane protein assembly factor BamD